MRRLIPVLAGALFLAGCSTVSISEKGALRGVDVKGAAGRADRTLCVGNEGCFLFNSIPLIAGSMDWDAHEHGVDLWSLALFRDETSAARVTDAFYRYAERENCDVVDVVVDDMTVYPIGVSSPEGLWCNLFARHKLYVTGVLKPRR